MNRPDHVCHRYGRIEFRDNIPYGLQEVNYGFGAGRILCLDVAVGNTLPYKSGMTLQFVFKR